MASRNIRNTDSHVIVAASRLTTGSTVYFDQNGSWSENVEKARVFSDKSAAEGVLATHQDPRAPVVDVYLAASSEQGDPVHVREQIRRHGPSIEFARSPAPTYDFVGVG